MNREERRQFFRSLSALVSSGITLHHGLFHIAEGSRGTQLAEVAERLSQAIIRGQSLSTALRPESESFSNFHIALVRIAEETGSLSLVLELLAEFEESSLALRSLLISRLTYPLVLLVFALGLLVLLPAFCLEGLFQVLENAQVELSALSVAFISLSRFLQHPLVLAGLGASFAVGMVALKKVLSVQSYRSRLFASLLFVPTLGTVLRSYTAAAFSQALALQLRAGVTPLMALPASADLIPNPYLQADIRLAVRAVKAGASLGESMEGSESLPPILRSVFAVGEESGKLPQLLLSMGEFYSAQFQHTLDVLASLLEPLVLALMGLIFAVMLVALMSPLVSLVQTL